MSPVADTQNKASIRRIWDRPILDRWSTSIGRRLTYFGLCGPDISDLLDWRDVLDPCRTGVESPGRTLQERHVADETIGQMNTNAMAEGVSSGFQILRADVE